MEIGGTLGKDYVLWLEVVELIVTFEGQFAVDLDGLWPSCGDTCGDEPVSDGVDEGSEGFGGLAESVSDIELGGSFWVSHVCAIPTKAYCTAIYIDHRTITDIM